MKVIAKLGERTGKALMRCRPVAKAVAKINKNKPELLAVSGGVLIIAAFGWAIYEAVGLKDTLVETSDTVKAVEDNYNAELEREDLTEEQKTDIQKEFKQELTKARFKGVMKVGKKFVLPTMTLVVGMGLGTKGFKVLKARNVVLGTALKGTQEAYKFCRENVREDLGKEADLKYARGIIGEKEIEETVTDENGKEKKVKSKVPVMKDNYNPWRFEFSDTWFSTFQESSDSNLFFIGCEEKWWNHELEHYSVTGVSMYDVLKHMGYKFSVLKESMTPAQFRKRIDFLRNNGWKVGSKIDLGRFNAINEAAVKRQSDICWIEMNCDGPLYDIL